MNEDLISKRLKDLEDNIRKDFDLLKGYEDELRFATDPRLIAKYKHEIERQRASLSEERKELEELKKQAAPTEIQNVADLLQQKESKLDAIQKFINVPSIPAHFLPRSDEIIRLGKAVQAKQIIAIVGMGGVGKSVLAAAFARATDTRSTFADGVVWLSIGQKPDILLNIKRLGLSFGDAVGNYVDTETAKANLPKVLADRICLIVLDDVWSVADAEPFINALGMRCRLLITTRDRKVVIALGAQEHSLDVLNDEQALALLAEWADMDVITLPQDAHEVARECGNLPLALSMSGAMVRGKPDRWGNVLHKLHSADLEKIRQQFPNYPYPDLLRAIQVSVDALEPNIRERYLDFAVFPKGTPIPESALQTFWEKEGLDEFDAQDVVDTLVDLSLARRDNEGRLMLHDLQYDYVYGHVDKLSMLHNRLLNAYAEHCRDGWASGPDDSYFFEHLAYHLIEAGRKEELYKLLSDFGWIRSKLDAVDVNSLMKDYDFLPDDRNLRLVQGALRLSAHILARDKKQLRSQLYGRLMGQDAPDIKALLDKIKQWRDGPWLRTLYPSLTPAGGYLIRTLEDNKGSLIRGSLIAVSVLPDGKRAISGSYDNTLKVWDMESGQVLHTLEGHTGPVTAVSALPDGKRAISGSYDNTLNVWDLESGEVIASFSGDDPPSSIAVSQDGKIIITGEYSGKVHFLRLEETGMIPKTPIEQKIICPKCGSDDVTFSKKKQLYVCPDCHHEFTV